MRLSNCRRKGTPPTHTPTPTYTPTATNTPTHTPTDKPTPEPPDIDIEVVSIDPPIGPTCAGTNGEIIATIRNNGADYSDFFRYRMSRGSQVEESFMSIHGGATESKNLLYTNVSAGQHTVRFTADVDNQVVETNEGNNELTVTFTVVDCPLAPVAGFVALPLNGEAPLTVNFTDQSTGNITNWSWNFGNGSTSTQQNPNHQYTNAGDYTVSLTVSGPGGSDSATKTNYIHVSNPGFSCGNVTEIPRSECEVLVSLYNTTNGAAWTDSSGWLTTDTPCSWYGVTCEAGHVSSLDLSVNQLSGDIPSELSFLSNLRKLWLSENNLTGSIPISLGDIDVLESLVLDGNNLSGSIPPELGNLASLIKLSLDFNELSGTIPASLGNLSNLKELILGYNQLNGTIPIELGNLTSLTDLQLSDSQLTGSIPSSLGNLVNLIELSLEFNQLTGFVPAEIGNLTNLRYLEIDNNQLGGPLPIDLTKITSLQNFSFFNTNLCIPQDQTFQTWLYTIPNVGNNGVPPCTTETPTPTNQAPMVDAGPDQTITLPTHVQLDGRVTDDGLPDGRLTNFWGQSSGPQLATFNDLSDPRTTVSFPVPGTYVFLLSATDGELNASDTLVITVLPAEVGDTTPPPIPDSRSLTCSFDSNDNGVNRYRVTYSWNPVADNGSAGMHEFPYWSQISENDQFTIVPDPGWKNGWDNLTSRTSGIPFIEETTIYAHVQARDANDNQSGWSTPSSIYLNDMNCSGGTPATPEWTIMVYLDGDDLTLDPVFRKFFNQYESVADTNHANIIVVWDQLGDNGSSYYEVQYDTNSENLATYIEGENKWSQGELNMTNPDTLSNFITWARTNFPAEHYALFISNHGTGVSGTASDADSNSGYITVHELGQALSNVTSNGSDKIDVVYADSCLMAMIEVAYEIRNYTDYYVASQNLLFFTEYYDDIITSINSLTTPIILARNIVSLYGGRWSKTNNVGYTLSAVDLSRLDSVVTSVDNLAIKLNSDMNTYASSINNARALAQKLDSTYPGGHIYVINANDEYIDLYDFADKLRSQTQDASVRNLAQQVMNAIDSYVINNTSRSAQEYREDIGGYAYDNLDNAHGVSIFLPNSNQRRSFYDNSNLEFAGNTNWFPGSVSEASIHNSLEWGSLLVEYIRNLNPDAPDNPNPPNLAAALLPEPPDTTRIYLPVIQK